MVYKIKVVDINGQEQTIEKYSGKVILIVNVASKCGFTPQYRGLEDLYLNYKDKGFVILGFPCNQFASQEPKSEQEVLAFCAINYGVTFPLFSKIKVNGKETHPLYQYLKNQKRGKLGFKSISWNFTKFLIDRNGKVIKRYSPGTKPMEIEADILKLI